MAACEVRIASRVTADGDVQEFAYTAPGALEAGGSAFILTYREPEAAGLDGAVTTLLVRPDTVIMSRGWSQAALAARPCSRGASGGLRIGRERTCPCLYETPMGEIPVEVRGERVDVSLTAAGGEVSLAYALDFGGEVSRVEMEITVEVLKDDNP